MDLYNELLSFQEALKDYKKWLSKLPLPDDYQLYREKLLISAGHLVPQIRTLTGKDESLVIYEFGKPRSVNMWDMGLRAEIDYRTNEALNACIDNITLAIGKLEADIKAGIRDEQGKAKEQPQNDTAQLFVFLFNKMQLHPKIIEASESLFETRHYAQAIFEAFKAVNNFVKEKTGRTEDGKDLMAKVFNEDAPIIKLNDLLTQSDKDEQEGFKFLFMGAMVGIRNPKAHDNVVQTDPYRTLGYLAFASLLMKRVEEGKVSKLQREKYV